MKQSEGFITLSDGVRLFFRAVGSGPEIIIPNGFYFFDEFQRFASSRKLIFYDVRNRGFSDEITDPEKLEGGIQKDVQDLEEVRDFLKLPEIDLIGHSYIGLMVGLYALAFPSRVKKLLQICPSQPDARIQYQADEADSVMSEVFSELALIQREPGPTDPEERCKRFWTVLRRIYVYDPINAEKIQWGRCELSNERNFMKYWTAHILPSLQQVQLSTSDLSVMQAEVLVIHGNKDRSAPYEGGRDWAKMLPHARLLTVPNAAHVPWIEAPELVYAAINDFLKP